MTHFVCVSDIATIVDLNPYQDSDDCLYKYRKKYGGRTDERDVVSRSEVVKRAFEEKMKSVDADVKKYLSKVGASNSNAVCSELQEVVAKAPLGQGERGADDVYPYEIDAYIKSEVYKEHGKKYEGDVFEWLKANLRGEINGAQSGRGKEVGEVGGCDWKIYGKVDGMYTDEEGRKFVLEIKNRQNRLFPYIPVYEQVQVQMYMWIFDIDDAILVQHYAGEYAMTYFKKEVGFIEKTIADLKAALGRMC